MTLPAPILSSDSADNELMNNAKLFARYWAKINSIITWGNVVGGYTSGQMYGFTTDANGNISVTHGLGVTPRVILCQVVRPVTTSELTLRVSARSATTFTVMSFYNGLLLSSAVMPAGTGFDWRCEA